MKNTKNKNESKKGEKSFSGLASYQTDTFALVSFGITVDAL